MVLIGNVLRYVFVIKNIKSLKDFEVGFGILWKIFYVGGLIKDIRNTYTTYSKYKIYTILKRDYGINSNDSYNDNNNNKSNNGIISISNNSTNANNISISTIGRIITYLKEQRLVKGTNKKSNKDNNKNKPKEKRSRKQGLGD